MNKFTTDIYLKYKDDLDMFGFDPDSCDDEKPDYYIYAWYTKEPLKKYFYVGKGKRNRYLHIIQEITAVINNPRKYKGKHYKLLQDNFGIKSEFLYKELTEKEATILEAYSLKILYERKEPLLNVIIPCSVMHNEKVINYRDSYFYESNPDKFLTFYK